MGDTTSGLTGTEIGRFLADSGISDVHTESSKKKRLLSALSQAQALTGNGMPVIHFLMNAYNPVRYTRSPDAFSSIRQELNLVLSFCGYEFGEDGKVRFKSATRTIPEAEERAGRLRKSLADRGVHASVLSFCRSELLQKNYFHAVFEATKSITQKVRELSGLQTDGVELVEQAFGLGATNLPFLAFNKLESPTQQSEHKGLTNLMKGLLGTFRNVGAHAPKIHWEVTEQDALDLLTMASFIHRRLDSAIRTPKKGSP